MAASIEFDDSRWPLVVVRFNGPCTDEEFVTYLSKLTHNLERAKREAKKTALIFDATHSAGADAKQRKMQADWTKLNAVASRLHSAGYAFVIPSALVRGVFTAILWLSPMPAPYVIVGTFAEAASFCMEKLREANDAAREAG